VFNATFNNISAISWRHDQEKMIKGQPEVLIWNMHKHVAGLNQLMRFQLSPLADDVTPTTLCHIDSMLLSLET
jgi:hypothetical protein